ncbi:MAG: GreA/GreB family elongation factor [Rhodocyclaceae bacterium]|jgi:regulator of nucleoside diphosphate kinase|nr:GreA/GreB family elongation factor [Rhodocyclaceae bacterium]MDO9601307.1 GreA/GreB family elongation factor [Rhodocyclaceae bacterium]
MSMITLADRLLNELDHRRLTLLRGKQTEQDIPAEFDELLEAADIVPPTDVPPDRVTMYSQILVEEPEFVAPRKLVVCYPADSDPAAGFISVLSPLGAALLGQRAGDTANWHGPDGTHKHLRIASILFQPEASGDYTL